MRMGQRHRHVEVGHARVEAGVEDRLVEARVAGVQHRVGRARARSARRAPRGRRRRRARPRSGRVRPAARPPRGRARARRRPTPPAERGTSLGDRRERRPDAACSDDQDPHRSSVTQIDLRHGPTLHAVRRDARRRLTYAAPIRAVPNDSTP